MFWASFGSKIVAKNFHQIHNLVTLVVSDRMVKWSKPFSSHLDRIYRLKKTRLARLDVKRVSTAGACLGPLAQYL